MLDLSPTATAKGAIDTKALRWRTLDGQTGVLHRGDGGAWHATRGWTDDADTTRITVGARSDGAIKIGDASAPRIAFDVRETTFTANGARLFGRLTLPRDTAAVPVIVDVHGSENYSATANYPTQRLYPAAGVGSFVYDKRGTGRSSGKYTQDFQVLAVDAGAAVRAARAVGGRRVARIGLSGASQGGWIAPLAAASEPVDFVIVSYGLITSPLRQNHDQTVLEVARRGFGASDQAAAGEVADAAGEIMRTRYASGFDRLAALRAQYGTRPWFAQLSGQFTGVVLKHSAFVLRMIGKLSDVHTSWDYDGTAAIERLATPSLWLFGGADILAPSDSTRAILARLAAEGNPITVSVLPGADHGMRVFTAEADSARKYTGVSPSYYSVLISYAKSEKRAREARQEDKTRDRRTRQENASPFHSHPPISMLYLAPRQLLLVGNSTKSRIAASRPAPVFNAPHHPARHAALGFHRLAGRVPTFNTRCAHDSTPYHPGRRRLCWRRTP